MLSRAAVALVLASTSLAQQPSSPLVLRDAVAMPGLMEGGRELMRKDAYLAHALEHGFITPRAGETIGQQSWASVAAGEDGAFAPDVARGGWLVGTVTHDGAGPAVYVLEASGHGFAYVNGEPQMGDPYAYGYFAVPVVLRPGENSIAIAPSGRGPVRAALRSPRGAVELDDRDLTLPDVVLGEALHSHIGLTIRNCTQSMRSVAIETRVRVPGAAWSDWQMTRSIWLGPRVITKATADLKVPALADGERVEVELRVREVASQSFAIDKAILDTISTTLRVREPSQTRKVTRISAIDTSVQYHAVVPPTRQDLPDAASDGLALVLSLHGASVEAINQADSYAPVADTWIVCPTNRRPFGFDWEDWGRADAFEALDWAFKALPDLDRSRTYLTGHSMGGHGSWQLATLSPGTFAAVAPSAGWVSFDTYPRAIPARTHPMAVAAQRFSASSDTLAHVRNLASMGVFILHGDADDNVPVEQGRAMAAALKEFHADWRTHEEPGAGHWWDSGEYGDRPGAACTHYPPIFEMFERRRVPAAHEVRHIRHTTLNPHASNSLAFASVALQEQRLAPSTIDLRLDRAGKALTGTTSNVAALALDLGLTRDSGEIAATIDDQHLALPTWTRGLLKDASGAWTPSDRTPDAPPPGTFKDAYSLANFTLVYATAGTEAENAASLARARLDAQQWLYRGNGRAAVIADDAYLATIVREPLAGAILYGNADTNRAWQQLVPSNAPIAASRGRVRVGANEWTGDDLAMLALVRATGGRTLGLVGSSGPAGDAVSARIPMFVAGAGIPEVCVLRASMLREGWGGVLAAEALSNDWSLAEHASRD